MSYTLANAISDTRKYLKDQSTNVWTDTDITSFINEGILIVKDTIPEYFTTLVEVSSVSDLINIDNSYKNLIPMFSASRCFDQDEQYTRATRMMNEFESRKTVMEERVYNSNAYATIIENDTIAGGQESVYDAYFEDDELSDTVPELIP